MRAGHVVRHADRGRGRAGRGDRRPRRAGRAGAAGVQRHRGDDVGDPAGPRLHRPQQGREVRRLLPRSRRRAARRGRLRRRDARPARHPGRHRRAAPPTRSSLPYNDLDAVEPRRSRAHGGEIACVITEAAAGQHGRRPAAAGLQRRARRAVPRARRAVHQRRGDDRLPGQPRRLVRPRRRAPRPDDVRQGDGRRLPGRGVRRPRRRDGAPGAGRAGLPGRHAVREPGRDRGRAGDAARCDRRRLRARRQGGRASSARWRRDALHGGRVSRTGCSTRAACSRSSSRPDAVVDYDGAQRQETFRFTAFFHAMLARGVYLPPSAFESWFLSAAHDDAALEPGRRRAAARRPRRRAATAEETAR